MIELNSSTSRDDREEIIKKFKLSHENIINSLENIEQGISFGRVASVAAYAQIKPKVKIFQNVLLGHFGKQCEELFRQLEEEFQDEQHERKMIEFLKEDLKDMKVKVLTFFDEHSGDMGDLKPKNFLKDFSKLSHNWIVRIKIEEDYLFPLLEKL